MLKSTLTCVLLAAPFCTQTLGQTGSKAAQLQQPASSSVYRVSFQRGEPVEGANATGALQLPFQCTSDGTFFVNFIGSAPAGTGIKPPRFPPMLLTSVSLSGQGHTFRVDQAPELFVSTQEDYFASDSEVILLVRGARENKPVKQTFRWKDGTQGEYEENSAPQHSYLLSFNRDGEYRRTIEMDDSLSILHVGVFPSGTFLALGFDKKDKATELVMLTADGSFLKSLKVSADDLPESMITGAGSPRPHSIVGTQFVPAGHSILIVVQRDSAYPVLEVTEGGAVRAIHPKLPQGTQIKAIVPSDRNLYLITNTEKNESDSDAVISEVDPQDGATLGRFELSHPVRALDIACVHEDKFLSFDFSNGKIVRLIGSPEASTTAPN
jgi:hypothetical protein